MKHVVYSHQGQAMPEHVTPIREDAFLVKDHTELRWLGGAGVLINCRGTILLADPLLMGFDMPLLIDSPLMVEHTPNVDAILITHIDNDHFSRETITALAPVTRSLHAPSYVAGEALKLGAPAVGHDIGESFDVGPVRVRLTPARHNWQNGLPEFAFRRWEEKDYCGFWLDTPDGSIWLPGDSRLLDSHLTMPQPDVILFDFSDNDWHITLDGAVRLANTYPEAKLLCIHWGTVDAPAMTPFNGDPNALTDRVTHPERIFALCPGEALSLGAGREE